MKKALLVDLNGAYREVATLLPLQSAEYELTIAESVTEALTLVTERVYEMVILEPLKRCADSIWQIVDLIARHSLGDVLVMVHADATDARFHAWAGEYGAAVLSAPVGYVAFAPFVRKGKEA